jgi:hypothetical protein
MGSTPPLPVGRWALERLGGLLPPLGPMVKEIGPDGRGVTRLGRLRMPFRCEPGDGTIRLRYPWTGGLLVDELRPQPDGSWFGEGRFLGRRYGSFRMRPRCSSTT